MSIHYIELRVPT